jgi:hypothetical protein
MGTIPLDQHGHRFETFDMGPTLDSLQTQVLNRQLDNISHYLDAEQRLNAIADLRPIADRENAKKWILGEIVLSLLREPTHSHINNFNPSHFRTLWQRFIQEHRNIPQSEKEEFAEAILTKGGINPYILPVVTGDILNDLTTWFSAETKDVMKDLVRWNPMHPWKGLLPYAVRVKLAEIAHDPEIPHVLTVNDLIENDQLNNERPSPFEKLAHSYLFDSREAFQRLSEHFEMITRRHRGPRMVVIE